MNFKKIICWRPLLGGVGAGVTITILAYITFQSFLSDSIYGLWFAASFGSTVVLVFGYPDNEFAQPKNVLFGHLLCALIGILFVILFKITQDRTIFFLAVGLAVGISVMFMMDLKIAHPPAGQEREPITCSNFWNMMLCQLIMIVYFFHFDGWTELSEFY